MDLERGRIMYEMKPEYYTGIEAIDNEHERLFHLAQETYDLLQADLLQDKTEQLIRLISELIDYTRTHFSHEEEFQKSIRYPQLEVHMELHRKFEDRLMKFDLDAIEDDLEGQDDIVEKLLNFLVEWLVEHILKIDMMYVEYYKKTQ